MAIFTLLIFAIPFAMALALSYHSGLGPLRQSALNPMLLVCGYVGLVAADFGSMVLTSRGELAQHYLSAPPGTLLLLQAKFAIMLITFLSGIAVAFAYQVRRPSQEAASSAGFLRTPFLVMYVGIIITWLLLVLSLGINVEALADTVDIKSATSGEATLFVFSLLLLPALIYALPRQPLKIVLPLTILSIAILLISGSRTRILYVLIPVAFYVVRVRGIHVPRWMFVFFVVLIGCGAFVSLNFRIATSSGQSLSAERLLNLENILNENDISFAEVNLAMSRLPRRELSAYPGEGFVGFVTAAIPRSIVPFKPVPGSRQFTAAYDPFQFAKYGRGLTTGAINEIEYDYPFPIAIVVIGLVGGAWGVLFVNAIRSRTIHGFAWATASYVFLYVFLKADLQATGQLVSVMLLYFVVVKLLQTLRQPGRGPEFPRKIPSHFRPVRRPDAGSNRRVGLQSL